MTVRKAVFDSNNFLIGAQDVPELAVGEVDPGDLPLDGTYQFIDGAFVHQSTPPSAASDVLREIIRELETSGTTFENDTISRWKTWYDNYVASE